MRPIMKIDIIRVSLLAKLLKSDCSLRLMMMMVVVVGRMVIRIILGSYLQFGGTVSKGEERQMCRRGTSWFIHCSPFLSSAVLFTSVLFSSRVQCRAIHSHFSVSIAPHSAAHHCYFQSPRWVLLHVGHPRWVAPP